MKITVEENPSLADLSVLSDGLCSEAYEKRGLSKFEHFCFFLRNEQLQVMGGIHGVIYYGCMYIDELWVEKNHRGQGYGVSLVKKAEELAVEKKCLMVTVNTMDFEARPFYEKLGYVVEFQRGGYLNSSTLYFLIKHLVII